MKIKDQSFININQTFYNRICYRLILFDTKFIDFHQSNKKFNKLMIDNANDYINLNDISKKAHINSDGYLRIKDI
jgi:hypothetical protein